MAFSASASPELKWAKVKDGKERQKPERQKRKKAVRAQADANKVKAKARDFRRCRWHEPHRCFGQLESDHVRPLKMGGDPAGVNSETSNLFTTCQGIHREFPESFHNGLIWAEELEPGKGCDGPMRGMKKTPVFNTERERIGWDEHEVWREIRVGVPEVKR